ncbi:MAG: type II secretion system secretin GspD [Thermodesulfobacteriota bacterium]
MGMMKIVKFTLLYIWLFIFFFSVWGCSLIKPEIKAPPTEKKPSLLETIRRDQHPATEIKETHPISENLLKAEKSEKESYPPVPKRVEEEKKKAPSPEGISQTSEKPKSSGVILNFDNADLYEVIKVMAEVLNFNYLIDPRVKGVVNIHTTRPLSKEEVWPVFFSILKLSGATAIKKENLYEIVPFSEAKKGFPPLSLPGSPEKLSIEERYIIQVIPLKFLPVTEASKMIKPFLSDGADIIEHPGHNILILGDLASNVQKSLDILKIFDVDFFADLKVRIYPILNADVTEIAKEMERIFSSFEVSIKSGRGVGITFTPITRINSLLVVSWIPDIFEKVEGWLKQLDISPAEGTKPGVFIYYVQNGKAKDLADVLKQVFVPTKEKKVEFKEKKVVEPTPLRGVKPTPPATTPTPAPSSPTPPKEAEVAVPEGEIIIVVDETNNALVIRALPRDYKNILDTIKKLDLYPKQVLIEVLLAEITLDDSTKFGVEWSRFLDTVSHGRYMQEIILGATPPTTIPAVTSGIRYSIVEAAGRFSAAIKAAASDGRLRVISSPHLLASNNKEAKIQIGVSQPVLTTTYTTTATATTNVVEGTIEYKDVGIILSVTPRISDGGLVTMELTIEDSSVDTTALGGLPNIPYFRKKTAKTVLSVLEGQLIVIGGLIEDSKNTQKVGVPLLSKIPLIGALFGTQEYTSKKTELILMMTPHVITDHIQSQAVTEEFKSKVEGLKKEFEKRKMNP